MWNVGLRRNLTEGKCKFNLFSNYTAVVTTRHKGKCIRVHDVEQSSTKKQPAERSGTNYDDDYDDGRTPLGATREFSVLVKVLCRGTQTLSEGVGIFGLETI
jgi:hypothetical protein